MSKIKLVSLAALASLAASASAYAQTPGVAGERTAKAGYAQDSVLLGARLGAADVETLGDAALTYGVYGDYAIGSNLLVGGGLDYWNKSDVGVSGVDNKVTINDVAISAGAKLVFTNLAVPFRPYAGAALTLHRFQIDVAEANDGSGPEVDRFDNVDTDVSGELGADLAGGVMYRVQPQVDLAGEVRYRKLFDATVDLDQLVFTGGLTYNL